MTEEQIELLKKILSVYKFSVALRNDSIERSDFAEMLEELSKLIGSDVTYWSLYD